MIFLETMFEIKRLTIEDAETLAKVATELYLEHFSYLWQDEGSNYVANSFDLRIVKSELENREILYFGVFFGADIIGFLKLCPENSLPMFANQNAFEIERVYLKRESQGKGIGKKLMDFSIEIAQEMDKEVVWLKAVDSNENAIRFYENLGFTKCGTSIIELPNIKNELRGIIVMQKNIRI